SPLDRLKFGLPYGSGLRGIARIGWEAWTTQFYGIEFVRYCKQCETLGSRSPPTPKLGMIREPRFFGSSLHLPKAPTKWSLRKPSPSATNSSVPCPFLA